MGLARGRSYGGVIMLNRITTIRLVIVLGALVGAVACDNPTGVQNINKQNVDMKSSGPGPQSITVSGTTSVNHPGETSQLTATATFSDGTTKDVTTAANWAAADHFIVAIQAGQLMGVAYGRTQVHASYSGVTQSVAVRVLPEGMFLLTGRTMEQGFALSEVRVEVATSQGTFSTTTDSEGGYSLPAVGQISVRAEKDGFAAQVKPFAAGGDGELNFELQRVAAPADFHGAYSLTFTASPSCALPTEVTRRAYQAYIREDLYGIVVDLAGGEFVDFGGKGFRGTRDGNTIRFYMDDGSYGDYNFIEQLDPARMLAYHGTATGTIGDKAIVATFSGNVRVCGANLRIVLAQCEASDHRLEFVR